METSNINTTETSVLPEEALKEKNANEEVATLRLQMPKNEKKVKWGEEVVDNEGMGKKSSKCCCIYKKPRMFGESSSEDDSDEENEEKCKGPKNYHKAVKKGKNTNHEHEHCNACP